MNKVKCDESLSALSSPRFALYAVLIFKRFYYPTQFFFLFLYYLIILFSRVANLYFSIIKQNFIQRICFIKYKLMTFNVVYIFNFGKIKSPFNNKYNIKFFK